MIKITVPVTEFYQALELRDRIRDSDILTADDRAQLGEGGVIIYTSNPVRVCRELEAEGFI
jgi:hypothetical protein